MMRTGVFHMNFRGEVEELRQEHIDQRCDSCQFPYGNERCAERELIQRCWNELQGISMTIFPKSESHVWHLQHECPYVHLGKKCACNDFKTIEEAFRYLGLPYTKRH